MANQGATPPTDSDSDPTGPQSERRGASNGRGRLIDLEPGPEETVFKGIYPGFRDADRTSVNAAETAARAMITASTAKAMVATETR